MALKYIIILILKGVTSMEKEYGSFIKTYHGTRYSANGQRFDYVYLWYYDKDNQKRCKFIYRPKFEYYVIKDKSSSIANNPTLFINKDLLEKREVYYDNLYYDVANQTEQRQKYDQLRLNYGDNSFYMKDMLTHPYLYNADQDIEDYIISKFYESHEPLKNLKLSLGFYDIETEFFENGIDKPGFQGFPEPTEAPCPINIITMDFTKDNTAYCLILNNKYNKKLVEILKDTNKLEKDIEEFIKNYNIKFNFTKNSKVIICNTEYELICKFFEITHNYDPDFMCAWNDEFDIQTILNRLRKCIKDNNSRISERDLELEVSRIACNPKYYHRENNTGKSIDLLPRIRFDAGKGKIQRKFPCLSILDGTCWIDQMCLYAALRANRKDSYTLDAICREELGTTKYKKGPGINIRNEAHLDTLNFIFYNTNDVTLLELLNIKCKDIEEFQQLSEITQTRKDKVLSKSVSLINYLKIFGKTQNMIMSVNKNNIRNPKNIDIDEESEDYIELFNHKDKYGAVVSDPKLNDNIGEIVNGKPSKFVFSTVGDLDYSSLYPSSILALSIDPDGMVGKYFLIDDNIKKNLKENYGCEHSFELSTKDESNTDDDDTETSSSAVNESNDLGPVLSAYITSQNWSAIGEIFMGLPKTEDICKDIDKYLENKNG